uniref:Ribosome maturation protein SBDS n=1 Tax=Hemiselmis andersenii TaxID=464988 RepID=A0A6U4JVJ0_HEMAN|mmetsp:Transcript_8644/g.20192  ORF Transcript_8644/g.20192 Transcript_8644/m.20192 type:complete len:347 (-) Transcript_8644:138-1178(-)
MSLKQPMGQKLLTNVSVVRLKKGGTRFEIAAYPNMTTAWRKGDEKDLSEVLQIDRVYKDVEKGEFAKSKDLQKAFGKTDQEAICLEILAQGEVQLSERERGAAQESLLKEICTIVADKCINPQSKRPVTVGVVERALSELHFNPNITKPAKKQALEAIKLLEGSYPIERAPMRLKLSFPSSAKEEVRQPITDLSECLEREDNTGGMWTVVCMIHPDKYRSCDQLVSQHRTGGATIEVLQLSVHKEGDASIESHLQASSAGGQPFPPDAAASRPSPAPEARTARAPGGDRPEGFKSATAPGVVFATREELTVHMKSDWHKHNLKLKSEGKPLLSRDEFTEFQILSGA